MKRFLASSFFFTLLLAFGSRVDAQCPAYGHDTTCGTIITITPANGVIIQQTGQGPYDGNDDTLVGIVNNSNVPINSIVLSSSTDIFGFDGDGIDTYGAPGNSMDNTGYGGPNSYFTNINSSNTSGTVNFVTPLAPKGGSTYFSLEEALSSTPACSEIVKNAVSAPVLSGYAGPGYAGSRISATFTPNFNYSVAQAATYCGFVDFDWVQTIVHLPDPNPFSANNFMVTPSMAYVNGTNIPVRIGGQFKPGGASPYKLTGADAPFNDPPQGAGYTYGGSDYSYPFYCNVLGDGACAKTYYTLSFADTPANPCLSDASGNPSAAYSTSPSTQASCGNKVAPAGSYVAFTTYLAGVKQDGTAKNLGVGVTWKSTFNGTAGGQTSQLNMTRSIN